LSAPLQNVEVRSMEAMRRASLSPSLKEMDDLQPDRFCAASKAPATPVASMHWYAINTKPHQEDVAEANVRRLGIETFCPRLKEERLVRQKKHTCLSPLFTGYLFARFEVTEHYRYVLFSRGVKNIVAFGGEPAIVEDHLIAGIRARLQEGDVLEPASGFRCGQIVRIHEGPLRGLEAIFERETTGAQRAVLLLKALSYQVRAVVDLRNVINL
jgi:transcriptional antiterminator RfaH